MYKRNVKELVKGLSSQEELKEAVDYLITLGLSKFSENDGRRPETSVNEKITVSSYTEREKSLLRRTARALIWSFSFDERYEDMLPKRTDMNIDSVGYSLMKSIVQNNHISDLVKVRNVGKPGAQLLVQFIESN